MISFSVTLVVLMILIIVMTKNAFCLLLFLKIFWSIFIWANIKEIYQDDQNGSQEEVLY